MLPRVDDGRVAVRLDLACGESCLEGYTGVDLEELPGVAILCDLERIPWRFRSTSRGAPGLVTSSSGGVVPKDDSIDELHTSHFVEHVADLIAFMNEAYRVLRPGGLMVIRHPYQFSLDAWQDPTHVRALNEVTWNYFGRQWRIDNKLEHYLGITTDFDYLEALPAPTEEYENATPEGFQRAMRKFVNVCRELRVTLRKRGGAPDV